MFDQFFELVENSGTWLIVLLGLGSFIYGLPSSEGREFLWYRLSTQKETCYEPGAQVYHELAWRIMTVTEKLCDTGQVRVKDGERIRTLRVEHFWPAD